MDRRPTFAHGRLEDRLPSAAGRDEKAARVLELVPGVTSEPRHLIRAVPPSVTDQIVGQRLGALAVDNAMAGYTDFMVSQWLTEYVLVPLALFRWVGSACSRPGSSGNRS